MDGASPPDESDQSDQSGQSDQFARRRRMSAAEVRERMLAAAREIVLRSGMTISLEDVSLEDVMRQAKVPRSSVYRLWPYKSDFVDDLLCLMATPEWVGLTPGQAPALDVAREVVRANRDRLGTPEGRWAVSRESVRQAVEVSFADIDAAKGWVFYFALVGTVDYVRDPNARARIAAALEECERVRVRSIAALYEELARWTGTRPRAGYRTEHIAEATGAMMQGLLTRMIVARNSPNDQTQLTDDGRWSPYRMITQPHTGPGIDGTEVDWSFVASAYCALFEGMTELDPDFTTPEDL